ncbi:unnamed protein product [Ectocarpus sp. CCAP 1310/34]|nr:unnamed protein product [Ectocarpus sp. CCAP 1310/34]
MSAKRVPAPAGDQPINVQTLLRAGHYLVVFSWCACPIERKQTARAFAPPPGDASALSP